MDEQAYMKQLQAEVERLSKQADLFRQEIDLLQQQISAMSGRPAPSSPKTPPKKPGPVLQNGAFENFIGLRLIHLVGIVILVIGLSIGVKYAIDRNLISETARIVLAYSAGVLLYVLSLRLKKKYAAFSAILFSGAVASAYFTTYGAYVYYQVFSTALAFALMVALTVFTVYEALLYNRQEIALLGLVGAYGIPFLISKNAERADLFFVYVSFINSAIVYLSIKKRWQPVGRVAQAVTWLLFIGWAASRFTLQMQAVGFLFMVFFFVLFLFNALSFKLFHQQPLAVNNTYQIVFNNLAFCLGALLVFASSFVKHQMAIITFWLSVFVALQTFGFYYVWKEEIAVRKMLAGLSLLLLVIFIALRWSGFTVTLLWLLTAVFVFAGGIAGKSVATRMAAILLMGITLLKLVLLDSMTFTPGQKVIAYLVLGVLLLVVSFFYQKFRQQLFNNEEE